MTSLTLPLDDFYRIIDIACSYIPKPESPRMFPPSTHALKWCQGKGIEIGPSIHNRMAPTAVTINSLDFVDFANYAMDQYKHSGDYVRPDHWGEGDQLSIHFDENSFDFVASSHVLEHIPDPIGAIIDWCEVLKDQGIIYVVVPKRDALDRDQAKPLSPFSEIQEAFLQHWTVDTAPKRYEKRGHYYVWESKTVLELVEYLKKQVDLFYDWGLDLVEFLETDSVGNGHVFVLKVNKGE